MARPLALAIGLKRIYRKDIINAILQYSRQPLFDRLLSELDNIGIWAWEPGSLLLQQLDSASKDDISQATSLWISATLAIDGEGYLVYSCPHWQSKHIKARLELYHQYLEIVEHLLERCKTNLHRNVPNDLYHTFLIAAIQMGHIQIVNYLTSIGSDKNKQSGPGSSSLHAFVDATVAGPKEDILIISEGTCVDTSVEDESKKSATSLLAAAVMTKNRQILRKVRQARWKVNYNVL
jgi:hypothetical protein